MSSLTPNAASAPKPSLRAKPRPFGTGTPRARGPSARRPLASLGLYVHIPFCAARCPYCDFATAPARSALRSRYMEALDVEIRREGLSLGRPRVATLYVGGGTPSLLEPEEVARLGAALRDAFDLRPVEAAAVANWPGAGWRSVERWRRRAAASQPDDAGIAGLYELAERVLGQNGYRHYEIANWALPGKRCRHNLGYWRNGDWLGVGAGAHSHLAGVRSRDVGVLPAYIAAIDRGGERIVDSAADEVDTAMLALRLDDGLDLVRYGSRFGQDAAARVQTALCSLDGTRLLRWSGERVRLTARGRLLANEVFVRLLPDDTSVSTSVQ